MEQLPGRDSIFLAMETANVHGHTGGLVILDPSGVEGFGFASLKRMLAGRIALAPKFTWKLREVPLGLDRPFWVADPDFDVANHMHRIGVPSPGGMPELAELCGHLFSQKLDRRRPLWEMWYVEGLENGRVAIFAKTHHCLMDGVAGADLGRLLMDLTPEPPSTVTPPPAPPAPPATHEPGDLALALRGLSHLAGTPVRIARYSGQALRRGAALLSHVRDSERPPVFGNMPRLSFNAAVGPRRGFACASVSLSRVKALGKRFDVKVNDVILELCGSAVRRTLLARGELPDESLVVSCPVSTREAGDDELGNQVAVMNVRWATHLDDPIERLLAIHRSARQAKEVTRSVLAHPIRAFGDTVPPGLIQLSCALADAAGAAPMSSNAIVSNVPGPPIALYSAGARVEAIYPLSILAPGQGLNFTAMSFLDRIDVGLTFDPDLVPDAWQIADGIPAALEDLEKAAELENARPLRAIPGSADAIKGAWSPSPAPTAAST